jgi:hypothetical protein
MANNLFISYELEQGFEAPHEPEVLDAIFSLDTQGTAVEIKPFSFYYVNSNYSSGQAADIVSGAMNDDKDKLIIIELATGSYVIKGDPNLTLTLRKHWARE